MAEVTGIEFNALAANLYRDGHDSIGWHSDDEKIFGRTPIIASLSFGDERVFELRKKPPPVNIDICPCNFPFMFAIWAIDSIHIVNNVY